MKDDHNKKRHLADIIRQMPICRAIEDRNTFVAAATVAILGREKWEKASFSASLIPMIGKSRPRRDMLKDRYLWEFEFDDDAMLFLMNFGGKLTEPD